MRTRGGIRRSVGFWAALAVVCATAAAPEAWALTSPSFLLEHPEKKAKPEPTRLLYSYHFYTPTTDSSEKIHNFGLSKHTASARVPLTDEKDSRTTFQPRAKYLRIDSDAILPGTNTKIPAELYEFSAQLSHVGTTANNVVWGYSFRPMTVSDHPFHANTVAVDTTLFVRPPGRLHSLGRWIYYVDFSTVRLFFDNLPILGAGYVFQPSPDTEIMVGAPAMSFSKKLNPALKAEVKFNPAQDLSAELQYTLTEMEWVSLAASWEYDAYLRQGRAHASDRLVFNRKQVTLSLGTPVLPGTVIWATGGYSFDREVYEGTSFWDHSHGRQRFDSALIASMGLYIYF